MIDGRKYVDWNDWHESYVRAIEEEAAHRYGRTSLQSSASTVLSGVMLLNPILDGVASEITAGPGPKSSAKKEKSKQPKRTRGKSARKRKHS